MSREEAAANAIHQAEISGPRAGAPLDRLAEAALTAADAYDAAHNVHRVVLDDATVERAAEALYMSAAVAHDKHWHWDDIGRQRQDHFKRRARAVLAAAVKEES